MDFNIESGSHGFLYAARALTGGLNTIFLNTNNPNDTNNFLHADFYSVFYTHTDRTDIVRGGALTGGLNTRFLNTNNQNNTNVFWHTDLTDLLQ